MSTSILTNFGLQNSPDDQLVSQAKSGDERAFAELCLRYSGILKGRIFQIVRHREDTEDVLQETFLKAYLHLRSFRGDCRFSTWIMKIGINASLMLLRKRGTLSEAASELVTADGHGFETPEFRDPGLNPEQRCISDETIDRLRSTMRHLPARMRTVMDLYCVQELRLKDAAAILGITEATAKSRVLRGRNRLRHSLTTRRIPERATVMPREDHPPA